jgi:Domain of unknown function (DUF4331)
MYGSKQKRKFNLSILKNQMMKATIKILSFVFAGSAFALSCKKSDTPAAPVVYYEQQDQMARPAINTVFVPVAADKDQFNTTPPSAMNAAFQSKFQTRLLALNPGYTTNALTQNAAAFTGLLATDVLNVSTTGPTTFFDGVPANTLSGRALADDVIDVELLLIFGGPAGTSNPGLTKDNVNANDKAFLPAFPYLASPW